MKRYFIAISLVPFMALFGDSAQDSYESARDNAADCHMEHEMGEFDYPELVRMYREARDVPLIAIEVAKAQCCDAVGVE